MMTDRPERTARFVKRAVRRDPLRVTEALGRTDLALATVSHEMRNQLVPILLWAGALREGNLTQEESRQTAARLEEGLRRLAVVVGDLLDRSCMLSGKLRLAVRAVDATSAARAAVDLVRPLADQKAVRLELRADPRVAVLADEARLHQVLGNLLSNAVKFTPAGGRVRISACRRDGEAEFRVTDTGEGIPVRSIPHLFEPFHQGASSDAEVRTGLGLGLAISRHLVELHGGRVWAESEGPGRGSTFVAVLPLATPSRVEHTRAR